MSRAVTLERLRADLQRWESRLPDAEGTYCQGIANKAFGILELLLKQLLKERLTATGAALPELLAAVRYGGSAQAVEKLPPGTVVEVLLKLAEQDQRLGDELSDNVRRALRDVVTARNRTTHEVLAPELRERTSNLLSLIDVIVNAAVLESLVSEDP